MRARAARSDQGREDERVQLWGGFFQCAATVTATLVRHRYVFTVSRRTLSAAVPNWKAGDMIQS